MLGGYNVRHDSQVMSIVDEYVPEGFVSVKSTKGEVSKPGLWIKVMHFSQDPLRLIQQRPKLSWRDVFFWHHDIRRPEPASRNAAAKENERPLQGEPGTGWGRRGSDERLADFNHRQAAMMNVHTDRPFGYCRNGQGSRTRDRSPQIL